MNFEIDRFYKRSYIVIKKGEKSKKKKKIKIEDKQIK